MEITLQREPSDEYRTHGDLTVDDEWHSHTLEDVVRAKKIKGKTAIPAGRYRVTLENSPRFGPGTITINDVPDFTGVRIHGGNTENDTEGCPLVGMERTAYGIRDCKPALDSLKQEIAAAIQGGEEVWITIKNAQA